jgi:hypothetical protein
MPIIHFFAENHFVPEKKAVLWNHRMAAENLTTLNKVRRARW